jgi:hypothetical protein
VNGLLTTPFLFVLSRDRTNDSKNPEIRFCFYTSSGAETETASGVGSDGGVLGAGDETICCADLIGATLVPVVSDDILHRSYSTSSIEDILHQSQRSMSPVECFDSPLKSRSSSCDDLVSFSGSLTPTSPPPKTHFTF